MHCVPLKPSLKELQEALRIRREIEALQKRLARVLSGKELPHRRVSVGTRAKLTGAVRARWARVRGKAKRKSGDIPTENPGTKAYSGLADSRG
jgi:hypothetical protein